MSLRPARPPWRQRARAAWDSTPTACVIAIVGAQRHGPASLAHALGQALADEGWRVSVVPDALHEYGQQHQRSPAHEELPQIALEQMRRIETAAATHDIVVSVATALTVAVYNEWVHGDATLYPQAFASQSGVHLTLLLPLEVRSPASTECDRDAMQERADSLLRSALRRGNCAYSVIACRGQERVAAALKAVRHALLEPDQEAAPVSSKRWQWVCERCSDVDCERHLLARG
jgi:hypothetical protein